MIIDSPVRILRDVKTLDPQFAFMKEAICVVKASFSSTKCFYFSARQHQSCHPLILNKKFMICAAIADFHKKGTRYKVQGTSQGSRFKEQERFKIQSQEKVP